ncbi:MAG: branched-chain amino acid aminotransferase [Rikenellaceae bacterium]
MQKIDWSALKGFGYRKCNCNIRAEYKNGQWGDLQLTENEYIQIHMSAPSLHYGAQAFEGLKAFMGVDGKVRIFRPYDNARRMNSSAYQLRMAQIPEDMFVKAVVDVVKANIEFVPPYGLGASLYIRPMLFGSDAVLGVKPGFEYTFCVFTSPVGAYFPGKLSPMDIIIDKEHDRAAPRGTGHVKCGGNYAASIYSGEKAHNAGYADVLYVDSVERKYVEECGSANFFGIKDGTYITPKSHSILPSITNMTLRQIAEDMGLKIEQRPVSLEELPTFDECGACGTAAVISPIGDIYDPVADTHVNYGTEVGPISHAMYDRLQDIQYGRAEDTHGWCVIVE